MHRVEAAVALQVTLAAMTAAVTVRMMLLSLIAQHGCSLLLLQ
jgi:hypothetical protein